MLIHQGRQVLVYLGLEWQTSCSRRWTRPTWVVSEGTRASLSRKTIYQEGAQELHEKEADLMCRHQIGREVGGDLRLSD